MELKLATRFFAFAFMLFAAAFSLNAESLFQPYNLDFEDGYLKEMPNGWQTPQKLFKMGYQIGLSDSMKQNGRYSLHMKYVYKPADSTVDLVGSVFQSIKSNPYKGRKIKFSMAVYPILDIGATVKVWVNTRDVFDGMIKIVRSDKQKPKQRQWQRFEVEIDVDSSCETINYGFLLEGAGDLFVDDAKFTVLGDDSTQNDSPASLNPKSIPYLKSFAKLYGYLKYYYPSTEGRYANWDLISIAGLKLAESCKSNQDFIDKFSNFFYPVAPLYKISDKTNPALIDYKQPKEADGKTACIWLHKGTFSEVENEVQSSRIININESMRTSDGLALQAIDLNDFPSGNFKFTVKSKAKILSNGSFGDIYLRFESGTFQPIAVARLNQVITDSKWTTYTIEGSMPQNAKVLRIGISLYGEGSVWFDEMKMMISGSDGKFKDVSIKNPNFEDAQTNFVNGWMVPEMSTNAGYSVKQDKSTFSEGKASIIISNEDSPGIKHPDAGYIYTTSINNDLLLSFPACVYADSIQTYPKADSEFDYSKSGKNRYFLPNSLDKYTNMTVAIDAWFVLNQTHPFEISNEKSDAALEDALQLSAKSSGDDALNNVLNKLLAYYQDSQARAWKNTNSKRYAIPLLFEKINDKIYVTESSSELNIMPGTELIAIEGKPAVQYLSENFIPYISASNTDWAFTRALAEFRTGDYSSSINITVKDSSGISKNINLIRNIHVNELMPNRPPRTIELDSSIIYIDATRILDTEFKEGINHLMNYKTLVVDLRGISQMSEHFLGMFTEKPISPIQWNLNYYALPDKKMTTISNLAANIKTISRLKNLKVIFLTDNRTIGFSEAIASLVKFNSLGTIIGQTTNGNAGEIAAIRLPAGFNMSFTIVKGFTPDGILIHKKGIEPDIKVLPTLEAIQAGIDPIIFKAYEIGKSK